MNTYRPGLFAQLVMIYILVINSLGVVIAADATKLETLGQLLFFDQTLSLTGKQSCASCHDPLRGFIDTRDTLAAGAVSVGDDLRSFGFRNTPSINYAALTPTFTKDANGYRGGLFLDGRAISLEDQALAPFLNPIEMALPDAETLVAKIAANKTYLELIAQTVDLPSTMDSKMIIDAVKSALAAFQRSKFFSTFDSKYDRYLAGAVSLSEQEERGRSLFFSQLANCSSCHLLNTANVAQQEPFTDYRYHNIGVPSNPNIAALTVMPGKLPDQGLLDNPTVTESTERGKFKVPSLRNVAVTSPYMHNGVFKELKTAVHFYNHFIVNNPTTRTNPETGDPWGPAETAENVSIDLLSQGQPMNEQRVDAIVAFLKTLTDKRYEALLE